MQYKEKYGFIEKNGYIMCVIKDVYSTDMVFAQSYSMLILKKDFVYKLKNNVIFHCIKIN